MQLAVGCLLCTSNRVSSAKLAIYNTSPHAYVVTNTTNGSVVPEFIQCITSSWFCSFCSLNKIELLFTVKYVKYMCVVRLTNLFVIHCPVSGLYICAAEISGDEIQLLKK